MKRNAELLRPIIPELQNWNDGQGISIESWILRVGNFQHAIGYPQLFWPEFIERKGCIFLAFRFSEKNFDDWVSNTKSDLRAVESVMNHLHITDLFRNSFRTEQRTSCLFWPRTQKYVAIEIDS